MADIFEFKKPEKKENHVSGPAICIDCKHEWVAATTETDLVNADHWLECPSCSTHKGRLKFPFAIGDAKWVCNCGNDLFHVTPEFTYCPNCGREQIS